jgi:hypothetical protein
MCTFAHAMCSLAAQSAHQNPGLSSSDVQIPRKCAKKVPDKNGYETRKLTIRKMLPLAVAGFFGACLVV